MRRGVERQPRLSSHPCHARRRAPCAPVGALAVLHQPARRGAMHPGHCVGRQPACLSTEQERMLRTLAQHQLASNQALSPLHSRPRAPAAALLNAQAQEPPLVVAALCSAACEQRSARQTRGTPGRLWDGGPPSECEPHRRPCLPQPRASGAKRQRRACFSVTVLRTRLAAARSEVQSTCLVRSCACLQDPQVNLYQKSKGGAKWISQDWRLFRAPALRRRRLPAGTPPPRVANSSLPAALRTPAT